MNHSTRQPFLRFLDRNRVFVGFAVLVFLTHGFFYNGVGWNQNVRLDSIYSVVEPNIENHPPFSINRFITNPEKGINTGDWAIHEGNYYSNKPPGTLLLGAPVYFVLFHIEQFVGLDPFGFNVAHWNAYLINLWVSVFFVAIASALFLWWLIDRHPECRTECLGIAMVFSFGTLMFPFDSSLWSHATAASFCLIAFVLMAFKSRRIDLVVGGAMGLAVLNDFLAALPVITMLLFLLPKAEQRSRMVQIALGGVPFLVFLLIYHQICFGSPFALAPSFSSEQFVDPTLVGGMFGGVSMENAYRLLVSPARGLLIYMPILCFSFLGALKLIQSNKTDIVILCTLICVGLLLVVSAFNGWHGGRSTGPRYLVVSLPFWCILLSGLCGSMGPVLKKVYVLLALISGLNMLVIVTVTTMIRRSVPQPLYTLYGWFFTGSFDHYDRPVRLFQDLTADQWAMTKFNWGQIVGLNGLPSIVPFLAIFGIGTWLLLREVKQSSKP